MIGLLIADDEEVTRRALSTLFDWEALGVALVGVAANGLEALQELERHHPAIVILDIRMPEMDGLGVLAIIRDRYPATRVILVSGFAEFADAQRAVNLAAFAFLSKPIDRALLERAVRQAAEAACREQAAVQGSEELRRAFERFAPALRASFLCRLLSPQADDEREVLAQAAFLGVAPPEFPASLVASVAAFDLAGEDHGAGGASCPPAASGELRRFALARRAERLAPGAGHVFSFPFGTSVCVLAFHGPGARAELRRGCREIVDWAASALGGTAACGIGAPVTRLSDLPASHDTALQALGYRYMLGRGEAIDYEDIRTRGDEGDGGPTLPELRARAGRLVQALRKGPADGDLEEARRLVAELADLACRRGDRRRNPAFLLAFVLVEVSVGLGVHRGDDLFADFAACTSAEQVAERAHRFLADLVRGTRDSRRRRDDALVERAKAYMSDHVLEDISLTVVADALGLHPSYLSAIFHARVGTTFIEHEIGVKMEAAKRLFAERSRRVYEVAALLQYRDVDHFTRVFRRKVGVSPSEYRDIVAATVPPAR